MLTKFKTLAKDWTRKNNSENKNLKTLTMCERCFSFYYNHSWHFERPDYLEHDTDSTVPVYFTQCLACLEQEDARYETESSLIWRET